MHRIRRFVMAAIILTTIAATVAVSYGSLQALTEVFSGGGQRHATGGGADFDLSWYTVDGGGAMFSTGGGFELGSTIGQPDAGLMTGGDFELAGGFWQPAAAGSDCGDCPTDVDNSGNTGASDLAVLLGSWGPCAPGDACECLDDNDDGTIGAADLAVLLGAWGPCV